MKYYITTQHYGGDVTILEQAAKDCDAELLAVKGYPLADFPGDRAYVEGNAEYIYLIEGASPRSAWKDLVEGRIWRRIGELYRTKYPDAFK